MAWGEANSHKVEQYKVDSAIQKSAQPVAQRLLPFGLILPITVLLERVRDHSGLTQTGGTDVAGR